jgi:hypothetical protein
MANALVTILIPGILIFQLFETRLGWLYYLYGTLDCLCVHD